MPAQFNRQVHQVTAIRLKDTVILRRAATPMQDFLVLTAMVRSLTAKALNLTVGKTTACSIHLLTQCRVIPGLGEMLEAVARCASCCNSCSSVAGAALPLTTPDRCGSCGTEPAIETVGQPLLESGCSDRCGEVYSDVVSECVDPCREMCLPFYLTLFGGSSNIGDLITRDEDLSGVFREDTGTMFGFALGKVQGRNLRTELEVSYRSIDVNGLTLEGSIPSQFVPINGDLGVIAGMLNGYWEFDLNGLKSLRPYVGGGVGFAFASPDLIDPSGAEFAVDDDQSSFAWQWMAGLSYRASSSMEAFAEYRYFVADSFNLQTELDPATFAPLGNGSGSYDFQTSNFLFGLRIKF